MEPVRLDFLVDLGFTAKLLADVKKRISQGYAGFKLPDKIPFPGGTMRCLLFFRFNESAPSLILEQYEAMLQTEMMITHQVLEQMDTKALEAMMADINWNALEFTRPFLLQFGRPDEVLEEKVQAVSLALKQLAAMGESGQTIAGQLQLKYWYDTSFSRDYMNIPGFEALTRRYYPARVITARQGLIKVQDLYELLVKDLEQALTAGRRKTRKR